MLKNYQLALMKPYFDAGLKTLAESDGYPLGAIRTCKRNLVIFLGNYFLGSIGEFLMPYQTLFVAGVFEGNIATTAWYVRGQEGGQEGRQPHPAFAMETNTRLWLHARQTTSNHLPRHGHWIASPMCKAERNHLYERGPQQGTKVSPLVDLIEERERERPRPIKYQPRYSTTDSANHFCINWKRLHICSSAN